MLRPFLTLLVASSAMQAQSPGIRLVNPMDFGTLTVKGEGGMVDLTGLGVLVPIGSGVRPKGGGSQSARLSLQGKPGAPFALRLDPPSPVLVGPQGARIQMQAFNPLPVSLQGVFNAGGNTEIQIGGRLDLRQSLPAGAYVTEVRLQMSTPGAKGRLAYLSHVFQVRVYLQPSMMLSCLRGLDFGKVMPGLAPGQIEVRANGGYLASPAGGPTVLRGGTPGPALFLFQGEAGSRYSIQVPSQVVLNGPRPIIVNGLTLNVPTQGVLRPSGEERFAVGGKVVIQPDQPDGAYQGTLRVTVAYQ